MSNDSLGSVLKLRRSEKRLTQSEAAFRAAMSTRHLSFLETGRALASRGAIERLAGVFELSAAQTDELRMVAGFAPRSATRPTTTVADLFELAVDLDNGANSAAMSQRSRDVLSTVGVKQYFFGRIRQGSRGGRFMHWHNPATFPAGGLERYRAQNYAAADPLLAMAERHDRSFLWEEALVCASPSKLGRRMFADAASAGITNGAVVPLHRAGGITDFVSFMGSWPDRDRSLIRVGLQAIGLQMLDNVRGNLDERRPDKTLPIR